MPDNQKLQISEDGSHTLISEIFQVTYHSIHGATTESHVIFIDVGPNFLLKNNYSSISIFEMGFGTGLNALLTYIWAVKNQVNVDYHTIEAYPVSKDITDQLNYGEILGYQEILCQLHACERGTEINFPPNFTFCKYHQELEYFDLKTKCDVVFFDAFSGSSLRNAIGLLEVGEAVRLDILRNGQPLTLNARVGEYMPAKAEGDDIDPRLAGAFFEDIGPNSPLSGKVQELLVEKVDSGIPAARAGLRLNDIITAINRQRVSSTDDLRRTPGDSDALLINLIRGRGELLLVLR